VNYNNFRFWILFGLVYLVYWRLDRRRQNTLLLVASYVFYGAWDYRFLFLILLSTVIDFIGGLGVAGVELPARKRRNLGVLLIGSSILLTSGIHYDLLFAGDLAAALPLHARDWAIPLATLFATVAYGVFLPRLYRLPTEQRRKVFLVISMVANLAILGFFKYCDFFIDSVTRLFDTFGLGTPSWTTLNLILPAGISFYTFQAMSYTIDIYRRQTEPTQDFGDFALFVAFFPHLVAGPIMRAHTLLPQVVQDRRDPRGTPAMREGLILVLVGLCKKLVIADNMAPLANAVFFRFLDGHGEGVSGPEVLLGIYAFALQIYGDFSGYSAIARGISKWLGFELVENFHLPYLAQSPSDFWKRWHISLSSWLRDYLYIPLGGNRGGVARQYRNLMLTMVLGGMWHGASFTFIVWGTFHGLILCVYRALGISEVAAPGRPGAGLRRALRIVIMFHLVCFGWLFFRADNFPAAFAMLEAMVTRVHFDGAILRPMLAEIVLLGALPLVLEIPLDGERRLQRLANGPVWVQILAYAYVVSLLLFLHSVKAHEFIYFQF
jgi:D-alanyl-lipoteichoic acid acyltransferase DltB (MBOAT superfamily)